MDTTHHSLSIADSLFDLNLPSPQRSLRDSTANAISWKDFMNETAVRTRLYLERFGNRENRPRSPDVAEFIWH